MVTEQGTIKVKTAMDGKMQKELLKPALISSWAVLIVGAIGVAVTLVLEIVSIFAEIQEGYFVYLIIFAVALGFGIALFVIFNAMIKNLSALPRMNEYEFFTKHFTVDQSLNGENLLHNKIFNNQITKSKETKNYLFFYVGTIAFPVLKTELPEAELNTLRQIFRLPVKGETVVLNSEKSENKDEKNN